ncbi:MAG: di-trans,poly-cis-decaprenylcistransferase [Candidatus Brocadiae bacterium]|nr:di-trans,poly-cis-decaprenylcistransferase [Candidatus Brocadiia bacterium]
MKPAPSTIPRHIAIIMDGNGRWAQQKGLPRHKGHEAGARTVRLITEECARLGVERLTLYAFSAENWKRPQREIDFLMKLLRRYLAGERPTLMKNGIRFSAIGRLHELSPEVIAELEKTRALTRENPKMLLVLALNYGGRGEILDAARAFAGDALRRGKVPTLTEDEFAGYLYDPAGKNVDLLIRTGGDHRISNFLLWEASYAELWFTKAFWPDFGIEELHRALADFAGRDRRFGGLGER